jgi:hypothetical protein
VLDSVEILVIEGAQLVGIGPWKTTERKSALRRSPHRRRPHFTTRPPTQALDQHRPRLRNPQARHANPTRPSRHRYQGGCRHIDNILSIGRRKPLVATRGWPVYPAGVQRSAEIRADECGN